MAAVVDLSASVGGCFGGGESCCGPRGMMVLLVKQVHLQKVGAAEGGAWLGVL